MGFFKAIGGGLLSGIGNAIGSAIQAKQSRRNIRDQFRHQKEMAEYQYSKDLEMWNRANDYNLPSEQMARLRAAGLNPNLVYGSGAGQSTAATQLPKYQAPRPDYSKRRSPLEALATLGMFQNIQKNQADIDKVRQQAEGQEIQNGIATFNKMLTAAETKYRLQNKTFVREQGGKFIAEKAPYFQWSLDSQLDSMMEQNRLREESIRLNQKRQKMLQFDIDAWNKLQKIGGKEMQFGLPFLRLILGLGR